MTYQPSYQGYMPYQNPYQQPVYQPAYQQPRGTITGRVVSSVDEVQVSEVPTDGTMALFPSADGTCVYGKRWTQDGSIATVRYVQEKTEVKQDPMEVMSQKLDSIMATLEGMTASE